jgi:FeoC-like transcriptional regulator
MLERLLDLVQEGGTRRVEDLARELKTTPEMVEAMLESLSRMGYLKTVDGAGCAQCVDCSLACSCGVGSGKVWAVAKPVISNQ